MTASEREAGRSRQVSPSASSVDGPARTRQRRSGNWIAAGAHSSRGGRRPTYHRLGTPIVASIVDPAMEKSRSEKPLDVPSAHFSSTGLAASASVESQRDLPAATGDVTTCRTSRMPWRDQPPDLFQSDCGTFGGGLFFQVAWSSMTCQMAKPLSGKFLSYVPVLCRFSMRKYSFVPRLGLINAQAVLLSSTPVRLYLPLRRIGRGCNQPSLSLLAASMFAPVQCLSMMEKSPASYGLNSLKYMSPRSSSRCDSS